MSEPIEPDEILPPNAQRSPVKAPGENAEERDATARIIARWLDDLLKIPGTKFRIGLDPLLAFIPGIGDFLSSSVSAVVMIESVRKGVSLSVLARMGVNVAINAVFDAIPVAGPFISAFFKSNSRNLELLRRWEDGEHQAVKRSSRIVLMLIVGALLLSLATATALWALYLWGIVRPLLKLLSF